MFRKVIQYGVCLMAYIESCNLHSDTPYGSTAGTVDWSNLSFNNGSITPVFIPMTGYTSHIKF